MESMETYLIAIFGNTADGIPLGHNQLSRKGFIDTSVVALSRRSSTQSGQDDLALSLIHI